MPVGAGIKLRHLQAFLEVARLRSLTEAASALNVTQPAVSKTLKELEALLGVGLMERGRSGVSLTAEGEIFRHYAGLSVAALAEGLDGIDQVRMGSERLLRVGALPSVAASIVPLAAGRYLDRGRGATLDHIVPLAKGGPDVPENLAAACRLCNAARGDMAAEAFRAARAGHAGRGLPPVTRRSAPGRFRSAG